MKRFKIIIKKKHFLIFLLILMILNLNLSLFKHEMNLTNPTQMINQEKREDPKKIEQDNLLHSSTTYSSEIEKNTGILNITLHQSYYNTSFNKYLNASDPSNNTFVIPHPKDANFNSSFTNITVTQVHASNISLIIENYSSTTSYNLTSNATATSFQMASNGYLEQVSIWINNTKNAPGKIKIVLYNSTWDPQTSKNYPKGDNHYYYKLLNISSIESNFVGWWKIQNRTFLDNSETHNNTWFIGVMDVSTEGGDLEWIYVPDEGKNSDGIDETDGIVYNASYNNWQLVKNGTGIFNTTLDFGCVLDLLPMNNTANPIDIGLKINDTLFNPDHCKNGTGNWISQKEFIPVNNLLRFKITANWWSVTCKIQVVQINYTKSNLHAASNFTLKYNDKFVRWNVSISQEINQFQFPFGGYSLNFSIPINWIKESIEVWNGTENKTSQCVIREVNNKFQEVGVFPAGNGTNWYLIANSTNLLSILDGIKPHVNGIYTSNSSLSYNVRFNVSFNQNILEDTNPNDIENITLYIFNPDKLGNRLNHTSTNTTHPSGREFFLSEWNITETNTTNINEDLEFRVQVLWFNSSAAAFIEKNFTIIAHENETLLQDFGKEFSIRRGEKITYEFNYTSVENQELVDSAFLVENHVHEGYVYKFIENANGNYTLKVNTSNVDVSAGYHYLNFSIGKVGYKPQNFELKIDLGASNSSIIILSYESNLKRADSNQTVQFYFNNCITNEPILGLDTSDIQVFDENGTIWGRGFGNHNWTLFNGSQPGYYYLNISVKGLDAAKYYLTIKINKTPNFDFAEAQIKFFIDGNESLIIILRTYDPLGPIYPKGLNNYYNCFEGGNLILVFYLMDTDFDDEIITEVDETLDVSVYYQGISNNEIEGGLKNNITFYQEFNNLFIGTIKTSALKIGTYLINVSITLRNYEIKPYVFNLSINKKLSVNISEIIKPKYPIAGEEFKVSLRVEYYNGIERFNLSNAELFARIYINGKFFSVSQTIFTGENGVAVFHFILPIDAKNFSFDVEVIPGYFYKKFILKNIEIKVVKYSEFLLSIFTSLNFIFGSIISLFVHQKKHILFKYKIKIQKLKKFQIILEDLPKLKTIFISDVKTNKILYSKIFNTIHDSSMKKILNLIAMKRELKEKINSIQILEVEIGTLMIYGTKSFNIGLLREKGPFSDSFLTIFKDFCTQFKNFHEEQGVLNENEIENLLNENFYLNYCLPHSINVDLKKELILKNKIFKKIFELTYLFSKRPPSINFYIVDLLEYLVNESKIDLTRLLLEIEKFKKKKIIIPSTKDN